MTINGLFGDVREFPDPDAKRRFDSLIGVDDIKRALVAEAVILLDPHRLETWSRTHHGDFTRAAKEVSERPSVVVLAGDVGTGKTELAESFLDSVARLLKFDVTLYPMSLSARGRGAVGEMTTLLGAAFSEVSSAASKSRDGHGKVRRGTVLLIDEADALAQSRELAQMHHEDRAGVNALIRGIDELRTARLPVLTVLCTNRFTALDPAVTRRAAAVFHFERPHAEQRRCLLQALLVSSDISESDVATLVELTGAQAGREYGCTYSDIRQRLIPQGVLDALTRDVPLSGTALIELAQKFEPTRPFVAVQHEQL